MPLVHSSLAPELANALHLNRRCGLVSTKTDHCRFPPGFELFVLPTQQFQARLAGLLLLPVVFAMESKGVVVASLNQGGDAYATLTDRELGDCRAVACLFRDGRAIMCKGDER